jgi:hypothetical protein
VKIYDFNKGKRKRGRPRNVDSRPAADRPVVSDQLYVALLKLVCALQGLADVASDGEAISPAAFANLAEVAARAERTCIGQLVHSEGSRPEAASVIKKQHGAGARAYRAREAHADVAEVGAVWIHQDVRMVHAACERGDVNALVAHLPALREQLDRLEAYLGAGDVSGFAVRVETKWTEEREQDRVWHSVQPRGGPDGRVRKHRTE